MRPDSIWSAASSCIQEELGISNSHQRIVFKLFLTNPLSLLRGRKGLPLAPPLYSPKGTKLFVYTVKVKGVLDLEKEFLSSFFNRLFFFVISRLFSFLISLVTVGFTKLIHLVIVRNTSWE